MIDSKKSAIQLLEELRKERNELGGLIQALEKRLGIYGTQQTSEADAEQEPVRDAQPVTSPTSLPIGFFHNLSQAAAAEKLLKMNPNQALSTGEILEAFRSSGMQLNPKNALTILYTALKRSPKFDRVGTKAWGLKEWYPEKKKRVSKDQDHSQDEKELKGY